MRHPRLLLSALLLAVPACSSASPGGDSSDEGATALRDAAAPDSGASSDGGAKRSTDGGSTSADASADASTDAGSSPGEDGGPADAGLDASAPVFTIEDAGITGTIYAVDGTGPGDVYLGAIDGIYHSTGDGTWTHEYSALPMTTLAVDGAGHVFAAGEFGSVIKRNADGTWADYTRCTPQLEHYPPTGFSGSGTVAAAGGALYYTFDISGEVFGSGVCSLADDTADAGTAVRTWFDYPTQITDVFAAPDGPAYILGIDGNDAPLVEYGGPGGGWTKLTGALPQHGFSAGVATNSSVWLLAGTALYESGPAGPVVLVKDYGSAQTFNGAWASSPTDVWFAANAHGTAPNLLHYTGAPDLAVEPITGAPGQIYAVWGSGSGSDLYAVGAKGTIVHRH
jgi:hypothetical protein